MKKQVPVSLFAYITVFAVMFLSPLFPAVANAQVGISLYPIKFDVTIAPGQSYSDTVTVINPNSFPIGVQPQVQNIAGGNQGSIALENTDVPHGLSSWITIDKTPFTLAANEQKQVPFTITVPANGQPGGNYGAILFEGLSSGTSTGSSVGVSGRVGSVVLVNVPGAADATGKIDTFTGPSGYVSRGPLNFSFTVEDNGNTYFTPTGQITLSGPLLPKTTLPFTPGIIFPGYNRIYSAAWQGLYAFGPMTATLSLTIPDSGTLTKTIVFFMFPWQEAVGIIILVIVVFFLVRVIKKNFKIVRVKE
jgi:hypothetical protein